MKGKAEISNAKLDANDVNPLAYNKVVEGLRKETSRRKSNSIGQDSVDFETAISKAGCGKFNYFLMLIAIPASCSSGFVTGAVSLVLPVAGCDLELTSIQKGLLNSAPYLGMVLSAFFWGFLSDAFGRQRLLTYGFLLDACMSVCASLAPNLTLMLFFKFLSGIMVCGPYSIFMAYLSEVFMDTKRDVAVLSAGFFSAVGNIFQPILAMYIIPLEFDIPLFLGLRLKPWRLFLLVCSVPSLICGVSSYFCVESPKFLMDHGKKEEALTVFKKIYTINTGLPKSTYPVKHLHDPRRPSAIERGKDDQNKSFYELSKDGIQQAFVLLKPPYVQRAFFFFFIQFGSMACLNVLRLWLPQMLSLVELQNKDPTANTTDQGVCEIFVEKSKEEEANCKDLVMEPTVFLDMIWVNVGTLFAHMVFIAVVKYVGKKLIISTTTLVAATSMLMIPLFASKYVVPFSSVVIAVLNITFFAVAGTVIMVFPTKIRATSIGLTMMFGRIGVLIANVGISSIMYTHCDLIFYILFAVLIVITVTSTFISTSPVIESPKKENNGNCSRAG